METNLPRNRLFLLVVFALVGIIGFILFGTARVSAAPANHVLPNDANWMIVTRPGTNGMDAPFSRAQMYTPEAAGRTQRLNIESACDNDSAIDSPRTGYSTAFRFYTSTIENVTAVTGNVSIVNAGSWFEVRCTGSSNITIDVTYWASSLVIVGGVSLYQTEIITSISSGGGSLYYANSYRFRANNTSVVIGISDVANPAANPINYTGLAYQNVISEPRGWFWSTDIDFALPCDVKTALTGQTINFFDTDHNESESGTSMDPHWQNSDHRMSYTVQQRSIGSSVWSTVVSEDLNSGDDVDEEGVAFTMYPSNVYRLRVTGINYVNSIQVALPQPSVYSGISCPPPPHMSCSNFTGLTAASPGGYMEVSFRIYNETSFTWVASGNDYDIGVVNPSFAGAFVNGPRTTFPWFAGSSSGIGPPDHNSAGYIQDSTNGTQNDWHREGYNRNANDGATPHAVERYGTTVNIGAGGYRTFSVRVAAPTTAGGSRDYGIRMLSRDARFGPWAWMNWSSSCAFTVSTTAAPTTACTAPNVTGFTNESITFTANVTTSGSTSGYTLKGHHRINSGAYTGWGNITGSSFSGSATFGSAGQRTITIQVGYFNPSSAASPTVGTTSECTLTVSVRNRAITCANTSSDSWVSQPRSYTAVLTNTGDSGVTVSVAISGSGGTVSPTSLSPTVSANNTRNISTTGTANASAGTFTITWTVTTPNADASGTGGVTRTCTTTISKHALPTCQVNNLVYEAGVYSQTDAELVFADSWRGTSAGGASIDVASNQTRYRYNNGSVNTTYGSGSVTLGSAGVREGQATRTGDTYIRTANPGGVRRVYQRAYEGGLAANGLPSGSTRVMVPGSYNNAITWTVDWRDGGFNPANLTCTEDLSVTIQPLSCTATTNPFNVGDPQQATTSIVNPNDIDVRVNVSGADRSTYDATGATPAAGNVVVIDTSVPGSDVTSNSNRGFQTADELTYASTGTYDVDWDIETEYGAASPYSADPTSALCPSTVIKVSRRPYTRLYGNDILAGTVLKSEGDVCTTAELTGVSNVGVTSVSGSVTVSGDDYYQGSAAELAAIATGTISNLLPGTGSFRDSSGVLPDTPLSSEKVFNNAAIDFLALAGGGGSVDDIGGGYGGGGLCNTIFPDVSEYTDTGPIISGPDEFRDGKRELTGPVTIAGGTVPTGIRAAIYVNGNVRITDDIEYSTAAWSTTGDIPLLRIYATGSITIDGSVENLDGLYVAGNQIRTCTQFQETILAVDAISVVDSCGGGSSGTRRLTLRGAFVANDVEFGRTVGDVSLSNVDPVGDPEVGFAGGSKAEQLYFYPELYIAMWDEGRDPDPSTPGGDTGGRFDYIASPPPVF